MSEGGDRALEMVEDVRQLHGDVRWLSWNDYPTCNECMYEFPCETAALVFSEQEIVEKRRPVDEQ